MYVTHIICLKSLQIEFKIFFFIMFFTFIINMVFSVVQHCLAGARYIYIMYIACSLSYILYPFAIKFYETEIVP